MMKLFVSLSIVFGHIPVTMASALAPLLPAPLPYAATTPAPLASVRAIEALTNAEAGKGLPVAFQATVTYFRGYRRSRYVQDGNAGIFVKVATDAKLVPGDRMLIKGTTTPGYRPGVIAREVTLLGHGSAPKPVQATFNELVRGQRNSLLVTARGVVQSVNLDSPLANPERGVTLRVLLDGGYVDVQVDGVDPHMLDKLLDAKIAITGVATGRFDGKMQLVGIVLRVPSMADIKILKAATVSPWALPETPMDEVLGFYHVKNLTSRVRVTGTITYFEPGATIVLQSGYKSIWLKTDSFAPLRIGDRAEATGFPAYSHGFLMLYSSAMRDSGTPAPVTPEPETWHRLASGEHIFDLVSIEGQVAMQAREATQDEYILISEGHKFSAVFPHVLTIGAPSPMKEIPVGTRIRVTGICAIDDSNPFSHDVPFTILLRTPGDLQVLSMPSWFTARHLGILVVVLLLGMLLVGARLWFIDHTMRAQVAALGYLGHRRGLILEDINCSRPLPGILERITELASATLKGAPCWCKLADGRRFGNCPKQLDAPGLRVIERAIASRSGSPLGSIYTAFAARTTPCDEERKALAGAAELATLAIETSRIYSDLIHRSEFDLLTDIKNRFAFEKHLDSLMEEAGRNAGIFGLIYIDLDDFKQVNDRYGHHVGDRYMQQAALRMKRQLRPEDLLARLGGDEFAVLAPTVQSRSDVEEIALRLECCFDEPFCVDSYSVNGSASIGMALYPADATTRVGLLSRADAAMYKAKHIRKSLACPTPI